jgi:hypothetical protein
MLLGHLAACGRLDCIAGLGLLVTVLDQAKAGLPAALVRWDDYVGWLTERGGPQKPSPAELGTTEPAPLADAPGTYIFES